MIIKYKKQTDEYTTYTLVEPDYQASDIRATELCTIGDDTYVHVPDGVILPEQPFNIDVSMEAVTLTAELKAEIKALSPHVQLSYSRLRERVRSRYSIDDEQYFTRISVGALANTYEMRPDELGLIAEYQAWVEESREIARLERIGWGLS